MVTEVSTFFANRAAEQAAKTKAQKDKEDQAIRTGGVTDNQGRLVSVDMNGRRFGPDGVTLAANISLTGVSSAATSLLADAAIFKREAAAIGTRYGSGSDLRLIATAISGAAGGNVTGSLGSFVQAAAVNAVQAFATQRAAEIADAFTRQDPNYPNYPNNPNARIPTGYGDSALNY